MVRDRQSHWLRGWTPGCAQGRWNGEDEAVMGSESRETAGRGSDGGLGTDLRTFKTG